ncbi:MAG: hypothetical protein F6J93_31335 [Oscillatoria sp. SIO1A7]|nr:hypothetical protein [Oscillatoria sp. SIO1A7]
MTNAQAAEWLEIHASQLRRDKAALRELGLMPKGNLKGYSREHLLLMAKFRFLIEQRGREAAMHTIYEETQQ